MSPPPDPSRYEGPNGVFRSVGSSDTLSPYETLPGIDSRSPSPWSADPRSGQPGCKPLLRAPVGSNTETDDDWRPATFHRGRFRCEAPFSISTLTQEKPPTSVRSLYVAVNKATIFLI